MKEKIKFLIKAALFCILFSFVLAGVTFILRDKTNAKYIMPFWNEKQLDVVMVGSSHCYRSIYPLDLWNSLGVTSYNMGTSEQSLPCSYYLVKEAIEIYNPKIVIMEMYMAGNGNDKYFRYPRIHQVVDNFPWSINKIELIKDIIPKEDRKEFYFNILKYHTRWSELKQEDFEAIESYSKGVEYDGRITPYEDFEILSKNDTIELSDIIREYLVKTIQICKETNTELILIGVPYHATDVQINGQRVLNAVFPIAEEYNVPYINMFHKLDEIGIDMSNDFAELQHLNISGARKVTKYLGEYINENYNLEDKRDNPDYEEWHKAYDISLVEQENTWVKWETNIDDYLNMILKEGYSIIVANNDANKTYIKGKLLEYINTDIEKFDNYIIHIDDGNIKSIVNDSIYGTYLVNNDLYVGVNLEDGMSIKVNGSEKTKKYNTCSILVYDKRVGEVIDNVYLVESGKDVIVKR